MELTGTVKKIFDTQTFSSGFQKREMILLTQEQYPQPVSVEFLQDKIDLLNNVSEGDNLKVSINIRGREWQTPDGSLKYFNSITGWRVEKLAASPVGGQAVAEAEASKNASPAAGESPFGSDDDDLPF